MSTVDTFDGQVTELDVNLYDKDATEQFRALTAENVNAVMEFEEAIKASGFNVEDITFIGSPFRILQGDEKAELIGVPFFIRSWRFTIDKDTERPYVVIHAITKANDMVIITDGSTGIHKQLEALTVKRISEGHAAPMEQALVANGLRVSEYGTLKGQPVKAGEKPDGKGRTFYLA